MTRWSQINRLIDRVLDGEASAKQQEELAQAARQDRAIGDELERGKQLLDALHTLPLEPSSIDLVARARAESRRQPAPETRWLHRPLAMGALAAGIAAVCVLWFVSTGTRTAPLRATDVRGVVWIAQTGEPRQLIAGDLVRAGSHLETTATASVRLTAGDAVSILLEPSSRLGVGSRWRSSAVVTIEGGSIEVEAYGAAPLEVRLRGSLHHVRIRNGKTRVLHDGVDRAVVACLSGAAIIDDGQGLDAGREVELRPGAEPKDRPSPNALALSVTPPTQTPGRRIVVSGRTNPGAHVFINGVRVRVDDAGEFEQAIELAPGMRSITVEARDVIGRERNVTVALAPATPDRRRRRDARDRIETQWQWENPPGEGPG